MKIKSFLAKRLVLYGMVRFSLLLDNSSGALEKTATLILSLVGSLFSFKRFLWLVNVNDDDENESEDE